MDDALRTDVDQVLTVAAQCPAGFRTEVAKLPGVRAVSCGGAELLDGQVFAFIQVNGSHMPVDVMAMLPSGFALLGVAPVAGSLSGLPADGDREITRAVINETASRRLGYASPEAAIGQRLPSLPVGADSGGRMRVAAVVPDFAFYSVETAIEPAVYLNRPAYPGGKGLVLIRLSGRSVPETLRAIDRLWGETGGTEPIERAFLSDHIEGLYRDLERNTQLFAAFAGVAAFLACLGLIGLSVSIAERRTKEIGVRKALGARTDQILALLLWQIGRPIVWANLIAWPAAWWLMRSWLDGFAYRVPLQAWLFPTAGVIAAAIAAASIGAQSFAVARRKPAVALRYE
jgi:putative ABC transport system permease protein